MDEQELAEEIKTIEDIIDIRKYRFRKDMHELNDDLRTLKKDLKVKSENLSAIVIEEKEKASVEKEE